MVPGRKFSSTTSAEAISRSQDFLPFGRLQVQGEALLVAVDGEEVRRLAAHERRPAARVVALAGLLDLDHLGAHVAQRHGAEGPGEHAGEVDDPHAGQRRTGGRPAGRGLRAGGGGGLAGAGLSLRHGASCSTCLDDALADRGDLLTPGAGAAPEEARPVRESDVREVEHGVYRFHRHPGADLHALGGLPWQNSRAPPRARRAPCGAGARNPSGGECRVVNETTSPTAAATRPPSAPDGRGRCCAGGTTRRRQRGQREARIRSGISGAPPAGSPSCWWRAPRWTGRAPRAPPPGGRRPVR